MKKGCLALACLMVACTSLKGPAADPALESLLAADVEAFVKADAAARPAPCQVLFVGSSSIAFWKTLAQDMAPIPVINRGFGGSHIEYVNRWFDQVVAPYRPRAIVFYAGENDISAGKSVDRVVDDFDEFMRRKRQALKEVPVYFISLKPSILRAAELPLQSRVNAAVRERATRSADLKYIDVAGKMLEAGKPKAVFLSDGLHMRPEGYEIWARLVKAALLEHDAAATQACKIQGRRALAHRRMPSGAPAGG